VIVFKQSSSEYSFAKVEEVKNDTVYFVNSNYSLNQIPSLTDYIAGLEEKEDFFSEEVYLYSQKEIVSLNSIFLKLKNNDFNRYTYTFIRFTI